MAIMVLFVFGGYYERRINVIKEEEAVGVPLRMGSSDMFDKVASHYDSTNKVLSVGWHNQWKNVLVRELDVYGTDRVLDLATGTGDVAIGLSHAMKDHGKMFGSTPTIIGVDPSVEMLRVAGKKIARDKEIFSGYVSLKIGSAHNLYELLEKEAQDKGEALEDLKYDKVAISFGVRNFKDQKSGLEHVRRVTKSSNPNGKIAVLEFMSPNKLGIFGGFLQPAVSCFIAYVMPVLGMVLSDGRLDIYQHLADSIFSFPPPEEFQSMIMSAGFNRCEHKDIFLGTVYLFTCSTYSPPAQPGINNESLEGHEPVASTSRTSSRRKSKVLGDDDVFVDGMEFEL